MPKKAALLVRYRRLLNALRHFLEVCEEEDYQINPHRLRVLCETFHLHVRDGN